MSISEQRARDILQQAELLYSAQQVQASLHGPRLRNLRPRHGRGHDRQPGRRRKLRLGRCRERKPGRCPQDEGLPFHAHRIGVGKLHGCRQSNRDPHFHRRTAARIFALLRSGGNFPVHAPADQPRLRLFGRLAGLADHLGTGAHLAIRGLHRHRRRVERIRRLESGRHRAAAAAEAPTEIVSATSVALPAR